MSVESFRELCNNFKIYHFITLEDYDKGIDYDGKKIDKSKYSKHGVIINKTGIPTKYQGYGLK